jgi:hypothetical protein
VQAPQSPALQPTLVPVSPSSSRSTWASRAIGLAPDRTGRSLTQNSIGGSLRVIFRFTFLPRR